MDSAARVASRYAPHGLDADSSTFEILSVTTAVGTGVARFRRTTRSRRATILLHGAAGSWTTWTPLLTRANELGAPLPNPVLIDLPGWGDGSLSTDAPDIDDVCQLVRDCAEELGYTEWDLIGHSMGGVIALHMAALWPQSVLSVGVVSGTGDAVIESLRHPVRRFWLLPRFTLLAVTLRLLDLLGSGGRALVRLVHRMHLTRLAVNPLFRHPRRIDASVIDALSAEVRPRSFGLASRLLRRYDPAARWPRIECAVTAVQGDRDVFARPGDLDHLRRLVPQATTAVLADCGHFAAIERPDDVLVRFGYLPS